MYVYVYGLALFLFLPWVVPSSSADDRPNIVVILCDDLGYGDLQCYGHPHIQTPHLNALAATGVRLTQCYAAAPVCSPSRVGLLTGRSPNRAGVFDWIPPAKKKTANARESVHMKREEVTVARLLKSAGYRTCMAGKWHCNSRFNDPQQQPQPDAFGFDHWFATQNNASPSHENPGNFVRNGKPVGPLKGYSCQLVVDEVVTWMTQEESSGIQDPFFVFMAFHEPHEPVASPPELVKKYSDFARNQNEAQYFANVENVDLAVGRLIAALDRMKLRKETLVIFTSDNGPETLLRYGKSAGRSYGTPHPLKGMKLHVHEAGVRVAGIVSWPETLVAGETVSSPISSLDFLPTFCALAKATIPKKLALDGTDISGFLRNGTFKRAKPLLWCYFSAISQPKVAIRDGPWKLLATLDENQLPRFTNLTASEKQQAQSARLTQFELYDLRNDATESKNLIGSRPGKFSEMRDKLQAGYRELLDDSPVWTPAAD